MRMFNEAYRQITGINEDSIIPETERSIRQVLYLDGPLCSGKTTVLNLLSVEIPDAVIIPEFDREIPTAHISISKASPLVDLLRSQFWFYGQHLAKDKLIRQYTGKIIADRGILGLFCYSNLFGTDQAVTQKIIDRAMKYSWTPGLYVFLTADPAVIKARFLQRNDGTLTETEWDHGFGTYIHRLHQSVEAVAAAAGIPLLDTSNQSPQEVTTAIKQLYYEFFNF